MTGITKFAALLSALAVSSIAARINAAPIPINDFGDLMKIGVDAGFPLDGDYELTDNIDAAPSRGLNDGAGFEPIGRRVAGLDGMNEVVNPAFAFRGTFDGRGFAISGLYINRSSASDGMSVGLFGYAHNATIKNLILDVDTVAGYRYVGGLVGGVGGESAVISGCRVSGNVIGAADDGYDVGGLAGVVEGGAFVTASYTMASVVGVDRVGGFVGTNDAGRISNSYSLSTVTGVGEGIGGFVGKNSNGFSRITNSFSAGAVTGTGAGGFAGSNDGVITGCHWDTERSGITTGAVTGSMNGRTSAEMRQASTFAAWSFHADSAWGMSNNYPYLKSLPFYTMTFKASNGGGTVNGESTHIQIVNVGVDGVGVTAELTDIGEEFEGWVIVSGEDDAIRELSNDGRTLSFSGLTGDVEAEARFTVMTYTLKYIALAGGKISGPSAPDAHDAVSKDTIEYKIEHGATGPLVSAVADGGFNFARWFISSVPQMLDTRVSRADTITSDTTFFARFSPGALTMIYHGGNVTESVIGRVQRNGAGGTLPSDTVRTQFGNTANVPTITAIIPVAQADDYHFVKWSDGVTDNPRHDSPAIENLEVYAIYSINTNTYTYIAGENGKVTIVDKDNDNTPAATLVDTAKVVVGYYARGSSVAAIPDSGYVFAGWSDGSTDSVRTDSTGRTDAVFTALFEEAPVSIASNERTIANIDHGGETAVVAPALKAVSKFTAGPNPVSGLSDIYFYTDNLEISGGELAIYDANGNVVKKISVDRGNSRNIAAWDLKDRNGRRVPTGTYLVRGTIKTPTARHHVSTKIAIR